MTTLTFGEYKVTHDEADCQGVDYDVTLHAVRFLKDDERLASLLMTEEEIIAFSDVVVSYVNWAESDGECDTCIHQIRIKGKGTNHTLELATEEMRDLVVAMRTIFNEATQEGEDED